MNTIVRPRALIVILAFGLAGCTTTAPQTSGQQTQLFRNTRVQHAVLVEDQEMLKDEFKMQEKRTLGERAVGAVTLPFAAATETVFWPFARFAEWSESRF